MSKAKNLLAELEHLQFELGGKTEQKEIDKGKLKSIQDYSRQIYDEGVSAGIIAAHKQNFIKPTYQD